MSVRLRSWGVFAACLVAGAGLLLSVTSCAPRIGEDPTAFKGVLIPTPTERPHFTLTTTDGEPYNFFEKTKGRLTFLFFGYTNCPDVCPVHMANLSSAIYRLTFEDRQKISVIFVTADPKRDTPAVLKKWLSGFDRSFVGLTGSEEEVDLVHAALNLGKPVRDEPRKDGQYAVGHAGQIIVIQPNDTSYVVYPFGTRQQDWSNDLPMLIDGTFRTKSLKPK